MLEIESAKLASASGKNFAVLCSRFEVMTSFHSITDVVDDSMHVVEIKTKDDDLGMLVAVRKASRVREIRSSFSNRSKDLCNYPPVTLDIGKKLLVGWWKSLTVSDVASHVPQRTTFVQPQFAIDLFATLKPCHFETLTLCS